MSYLIYVILKYHSNVYSCCIPTIAGSHFLVWIIFNYPSSSAESLDITKTFLLVFLFIWNFTVILPTFHSNAVTIQTNLQFSNIGICLFYINKYINKLIVKICYILLNTNQFLNMLNYFFYLLYYKINIEIWPTYHISCFFKTHFIQLLFLIFVVHQHHQTKMRHCMDVMMLINIMTQWEK